MFFVLNTGRAGSKTIAQTLSQAPDCLCLHEPEPRLIEESVRYRYADLPLDDVVDLLRRTRPTPNDAEVRGESNNRLALVVPALTEAFPIAKYLWLVRDGRNVVASAMQRGWYGGADRGPDANLWHRWRLQGDQIGAVPADTWASWDAFERNCWLWRYTNDLIHQDLAAADQTWMTVRIETLGSQLEEICDFLGITPTDFVVGRANRRRRDQSDGTANTVARVETWHDWTAEQRRTFEHHAGELMDRLYPAWRDGEDWRDVPGDTRAESPVPVTVTDDGGTSPQASMALVPRVELAELKVLRGELNALRRLLGQTEKNADRDRQRSAEQLERLHALETAQLRLEVEREEAETRLRDLTLHNERLEGEVSRAQKDAEAQRDHATQVSRQLDDTRRDRDAWRQKHATVERDLTTAQQRVTALEQSRSYRLGHGFVRSVRHPLGVLRGVLLSVLRFVVRRLPHDAKRWLLVQSEEHLPRRTHARLQRLNQRVKTTTRTTSGPPTSAPPRRARDTTPAIHTAAQHPQPSGSAVVETQAHPPLLSDSLPVIGYVLLGVPDTSLVRIVREIRRSAVSTGHVPLVITDSEAFSLLREEGVAFEHIPPAAVWLRHRPEMAWADLLSRRVAQIVQDHQCQRTVTIMNPDQVDYVRLTAIIDA